MNFYYFYSEIPFTEIEMKHFDDFWEKMPGDGFEKTVEYFGDNCYKALFWWDDLENQILFKSYLKGLEDSVKRLGINYKMEEVSEEILNYDFLDSRCKKYENLWTEENEWFFEEYLKLYLTPDNILDKINKFGIDSLTDMEKEILKYSN